MTDAPDIDVDTLQIELDTLGRGAVVARTTPGRSGRQRRYLRALGHALKPVVNVGHHGLTDALAAAIAAQLEVHELIKLKVLESAPCSAELVALWVHRRLSAEVPQILGRTVLCYRARAEEPSIRVP